MDSTPEWASIISDAMDERLDRVWTSLVAKVTAYDANTRTATLQPLNTFRHIGESGDPIDEVIAPLQSVPVIQMSGGPFVVSLPVAAGDLALVIVTCLPMGAAQIDGNPATTKHIGLTHSLESALAIVGWGGSQAGARITDGDGIVLGNAQTGVTIKVTASDVRLGSSAASQQAILGNAFMTALESLLTALNTFAGTCTTTPAGSPATALATAVTAFETAASGFLSAVVKVT